MFSQQVVQALVTIPVSITIPANTVAAAQRQSFLQLIQAAGVLSAAQMAGVIGGVVTARQPAALSTAPATRADFTFGCSDGATGGGTGLSPTQIAGLPDASLIDYAGAAEELDLKGVDWLRNTVPLSLTAAGVTAIVRVYIRS